MAAEVLRRMSHIVKQTLAFHRQSDVPTPISITDLVENVLAFHERGMAAAAVTFTRRFEGEHECEGYAGELRQVISNLLTNAVQAVEGAGKIVVHIFPSRLWSSDDRVRGTRIVIADNGSGIRAQDRAHIFEPFFTTKQGKGTGLGLWVAAGIVRKHNGQIRITSTQRGQHAGTTVSLFLPAPKAVENSSVDAARRQLLATRRSVQMRLRFSNR
jgi:signal transduction histidine kinase